MTDRKQFRTLPLARLAMMLIVVAAQPAQADEEAEIAALNAMLEAETDVATSNRMNADFVPGMVSVMYGEELKRLGARNAAEALDRVAGIYVTEGNRGNYRVQVRGVGATLSGSNIKILLNGLPMNSAANGAADAVLRIPIEQIQRVEVIRGPGSALYGEYAMTGVVNIITRTGDNAVGVRGGSHGYLQGDAMTSGISESGLSWKANVSTWGRDETGRQSNPDNFARRGNGNSPGSVDDDFDGNLLLAGLGYQGYQLSAQFLDVRRGDYFGRNALADWDTERSKEQLVGLALDKNWKMSETVTSELTISGLQTDFNDSATLTIPKGVDPPGPRPPVTRDVYRQHSNTSRQYRADLKFNFELGRRHHLLWGLGYADLDVVESGSTFIEPGVSVNQATATQVLVLEGSHRRIASSYLQDQWRVIDSLEVTLGARYDHYDDWGENWSPRLAAVWQPFDAHIFKFQYAESFRPPTLEESYPGPDLFGGTTTTSDVTAEELRSMELAYIYRHSGRVLRATLFKTHIGNLIEFFQNPGDPPIFRNHGEIHSWGGELEWEEYLGRKWKLMSNLSYVEARDTVTDEPLVGVVHWLANAMLSWDVNSAVNLSGRVRYVGEQQGWSDRVRAGQADSFDPYTTLDAVVSWEHPMGLRGLELRAGANNLLGESYDILPNPAQYPTGLTDEGRTLWVSAAYQFGAH
ncbi:TonB-dependent receptor plug domain-containing protein [Marinobacter halodurans]|nr:TonB-dependent receptor [Marinobacter halodurans]